LFAWVDVNGFGILKFKIPRLDEVEMVILEVTDVFENKIAPERYGVVKFFRYFAPCGECRWCVGGRGTFRAPIFGGWGTLKEE